VVRYCRDPQKAHPWPETRVLTYTVDRPDRSRNATCARGEESKKRKKERKETPRFDKSRMCLDHPRRVTSTKVVMWCGVPDVVNHAKFHQNRFRGFGSLSGRNLLFPMHNVMAYITAQAVITHYVIALIITSHFYRATAKHTHGIAIDFQSVLPSVCLSNACIVTKRKHLAKKVQL